MLKNKGLTLIECMIVIAISMILLFSATIAYRSFIQKNQLSSLVNQLTDALNYARDAAITLHTSITLQPRDHDWQNELFIKNADHVLRILPAMPSGYRLSWHSTLGDTSHLQWRSDGFTTGQQGSFVIEGLSHSAKIIILRTGRWRVSHSHSLHATLQNITKRTPH